MPNQWSKGSSGGQRSSVPAPSGKPGAKMRYVPPPAPVGAQSTSKSPPRAAGAGTGTGTGTGTGKMKYVPPPTNAGEWVRPKKSAGSGPCQWEELAKKEDERLKAGRKHERAAAKQSNSVGMSGNDRADMLATQVEFDLWTRQDVARTLAWARAEECRIPNKRVAKGGRLHKLINIVLNNCDFVNERLAREKRFQDASRDPTLPNGLELKRQFVGPLAKKVLNKVEDEEVEAAFKQDDPDSDDSEGMAM